MELWITVVDWKMGHSFICHSAFSYTKHHYIFNHLHFPNWSTDIKRFMNSCVSTTASTHRKILTRIKILDMTKLLMSSLVFDKEILKCYFNNEWQSLSYYYFWNSCIIYWSICFIGFNTENLNYKSGALLHSFILHTVSFWVLNSCICRWCH